jgi:hypothetical protein
MAIVKFTVIVEGIDDGPNLGLNSQQMNDSNDESLKPGMEAGGLGGTSSSIR